MALSLLERMDHRAIRMRLLGSSASGTSNSASDDVHRVAIIVSGESAFAVEEDRVEPGRTFDEILT